MEESETVLIDGQGTGTVDLMNCIVQYLRSCECANWPRVTAVICILGISANQNSVGRSSVFVYGVDISEAVDKDFVGRENFRVAWLEV